MERQIPCEYNPHDNYAHSGFDDTLVAAFVVHVAANEIHKLDEALESVDSLRVIHRQISEDHLYIVTEEEHDDRRRGSSRTNDHADASVAGGDE